MPYDAAPFTHCARDEADRAATSTDRGETTCKLNTLPVAESCSKCGAVVTQPMRASVATMAETAPVTPLHGDTPRTTDDCTTEVAKFHAASMMEEGTERDHQSVADVKNKCIYTRCWIRVGQGKLDSKITASRTTR